MTLVAPIDSKDATPEILFKEDSFQEGSPKEDLAPSDNVFRFVTDCV